MDSDLVVVLPDLLGRCRLLACAWGTVAIAVLLMLGWRARQE